MHSLIANPPYNMRWQPPALAGFMPKYSGYTIPPEQNANYAFILSGLELADRQEALRKWNEGLKRLYPEYVEAVEDRSVDDILGE